MIKRILIIIIQSIPSLPHYAEDSERCRRAFGVAMRYLGKKPALEFHLIKAPVFRCGILSDYRNCGDYSVAALRACVDSRVCREYSKGPIGWSGDVYWEGACGFDGNWVGLRSDVISNAVRSTRDYVIRHELQHEIQRNRDGVTDALVLLNWRIGYAAERDADHAAVAFLKQKNIFPMTNPEYWSVFLALRAFMTSNRTCFIKSFAVFLLLMWPIGYYLPHSVEVLLGTCIVLGILIVGNKVFAK